MTQDLDKQTQAIFAYLEKNEAEYLQQIRWAANPIMRFLDLLFLGMIGRTCLARGRQASYPEAVNLLSKSIKTTSSKAIMSKAFYYRGNILFDGAADADRTIADYSLAVWCDPADCWGRTGRATIYHMCHASYGIGDRYHKLPMTLEGALADAAASVDFFTDLARNNDSTDQAKHAKKMVQQSADLQRKLKALKAT